MGRRERRGFPKDTLLDDIISTWQIMEVTGPFGGGQHELIDSSIHWGIAATVEGDTRPIFASAFEK